MFILFNSLFINPPISYPSRKTLSKYLQERHKSQVDFTERKEEFCGKQRHISKKIVGWFVGINGESRIEVFSIKLIESDKNCKLNDCQVVNNNLYNNNNKLSKYNIKRIS